MLRSYLQTAIRNLVRCRLYTIANVTGLSVGIAGCLLIAAWVYGELRYDRHHEHGQRIYRVYERSEQGTSITTSAALGRELKKVPHVEAVVRMLNPSNPPPLLRHDEKRFYGDDFYFADPEVLTVFTYPLIQGDPVAALDEPYSVVVSESAARRLFGQDDPIGKAIRFKELLDLNVTGVMRDPPASSHMRPEFLASFATVEKWLGHSGLTDWRRTMFHTYLLLAEETKPAALLRPLARIRTEHSEQLPISGQWDLQPLHRIHLHSQELGLGGGGDVRQVMALTLVACLVLVVACLNYANLATALAARRLREVGLRRTLGASRAQVALQLLGEAALVAIAAIVGGLVLAEGLAPFAQRLGGADVSVVYTSPEVALLIVVILGVTTLVAGGYPALHLARSRPVQPLTGAMSLGTLRGRRTMVVGQFLVSLVLLAATVVIYKQLRHLDRQDLGIDADQVLVVALRSQDMRVDTEPVKAQLQELPDVTAVSAAALLPGGPLGRRGVVVEDAPNAGQPVTMDLLWVDHDAIPTLGLELLAGDGFVRGMDARSGYFVLTREAVRRMGWPSVESALGHALEIPMQGSGSGVSPKGTIVGVVDDFRPGSLRRGVQPTLLQLWPWPNYLMIRFKGKEVAGVLKGVREVLDTLDPVHPIDYWFLDDRFARMYARDQEMGHVLASFAGLSLLVTCVGLFAFASFAAERRRHEFGIRKVLGATLMAIARDLGREFTIMVLIAACLAFPIAYFGMESWLKGFAERVQQDAGVFLMVLGGTLLATWLTVAYHATHAANLNPVDALRHE